MSDNKRLEETITIFRTDALMMAQAMMLYANRAMFTDDPQAQVRLDHYRAQFEKLVPEEARHFGGNVWSEIGMALADAKSFSVTLEPPRWSQDLYQGGHIVVRVELNREPLDNELTEWRSKNSDHDRGTPAVEAVHRVLTEIAPLGCEGSYDAKQDAGWRW